MRRALSLYALLALVLSCALSACDKTTIIDTPTQVTLRISSSDQPLKQQLTQLRVRASLRQGDGWRAPVENLFSANDLSWPVDVPVFPRGPEDASKEFEVVVEALQNDLVLAQSRVVTRFAPSRHVILPVPIFLCPGHELGYVCAEEGCRGTECSVCTTEGECAPVELIDPADLPDQPGEDMDAGEEAGARDDAGGDMDAVVQDAPTSPEGGSEAAVDAVVIADGASDGEVATEYALGELGKPCSVEGSLACAGHASTNVLKCTQGMWAASATCSDDQRCDSRVGTEQGKCTAVRSACVGKAAGDVCDGTTRVTCGVDLITTTNNPCPAQSHCEMLSNGAQCVCDTGYQSDGQGGCTNPNDCQSGACTNGECVDGLSTFTCNCNSGYTGTGTQSCTKVNYCPKDACTPGGTCNDVAAWSCQCNAGYTGTGTQACTNPNDCPNNRCLAPNGTCEDLVGGYKCNCNTGFSGPDCVNDVCNPNPCSNGGTCSRTGTLCSCPPGYSGATCQVDACNPNPCQHGGSCSRTQQGASCSCGSSGYDGNLCQNDINECASANSCSNPEYPCTQTAAPGYTCDGQFADWPMPDNEAASKTKPSYDTSSTAGVVIDNVTGLAWVRDLVATYSGCTGNRVTAGDSCTWSEAKAYCDNLVFAGQSDWRLPSIIELQSTLDFSRATQPALDPNIFPNVPSVSDGGTFWTRSSYASATAQAWFGGSNGASLPGAKTNATRVRCVRTVRRTSGTPQARYTISGSSVVDTRTGLVWQRTVDPGSYTMDGAINYCASLGGTWRLPTVKELFTLIDPTRVTPEPAIDTTTFPSTPAEPFRTRSHTPEVVADQNIMVHFGSGYLFGNPDTTPYRVRCVR